MKAKIDIRGELAYLFLSGEIDHAVRAEVDQAIVGAIDGAAAGVVVDLSGLSFIDSTGIGALARGYQRASAQGRTFQVAGADGIVLRVLQVTGLDELFVRGTAAEGGTPAS